MTAIKQVYNTRQEWLEARTGIGASDIAALLGLNRYQTPYQLWQILRERMENGLQPEIVTEAKMRGQCMEEGIAKWFEAKTGMKVIKSSDELSLYFNDSTPAYIQVSPDRECFAKGRKTRPILECKDTMKYVDIDDLGSIPVEWYTQIQVQMGIMERDEAILAVCDATKSLKYRLFSFDKEFFDDVIRQVAEWWDRYIIGGEIPPITTPEDMQDYYKEVAEGSIEADNEAMEAWERYRHLTDQLRAFKKIVDDAGQELKLKFRDKSYLVCDERVIASYKEQARTSLDIARLQEEQPDIYRKYIKESKTRVLRIKK